MQDSEDMSTLLCKLEGNVLSLLARVSKTLGGPPNAKTMARVEVLLIMCTREQVGVFEDVQKLRFSGDNILSFNELTISRV